VGLGDTELRVVTIGERLAATDSVHRDPAIHKVNIVQYHLGNLRAMLELAAAALLQRERAVGIVETSSLRKQIDAILLFLNHWPTHLT
jgi:hypothetical protein